jgi:EAL domain-containing protein (putative c-di-GMP-specific phosphodiesterase class I)
VLGVTFRCADLDQGRGIIEALQNVATEPVRLGETAIDFSLTSGIAYPAHASEPTEAVIERASIALDQALQSFQKVALFDAAAYGDPAANLSLMGEMRRSITDGGLILHYQPKLDLRLNRTTSVEALVRWRHPARGLIGPSLFVPMAEETGYIRALTEWVLAAAIVDRQRMTAAGHALGVSVNISGRLLGDVEFADAALRMVDRAEGKICFEITETAVIDNPEQGLAAIDRFAAAGVAVSIDDYGTGLSSLKYLKQIRANELKIDQSFVIGMEDNERDALLVRSTIDLAHGLDLEVTAEGIETAAALAMLREMGCDRGQGYFLARPMPLDALLSFMASEQRIPGSQC